MPNKYIFPVITLLCLMIQATALSSRALAEQQNLKAEVLSVIDGKTLFVKSTESGKEYTVLLYGIDCYSMPESIHDEPDPFAVKAKEMTERLVNKSREITVTRLDNSFNPTIGVVHFDKLNITLQNQLLNSGLAWVDKKNCKNWSICKTFTSVQDNAKLYRYNIWSSPQAPKD